MQWGREERKSERKGEKNGRRKRWKGVRKKESEEGIKWKGRMKRWVEGHLKKWSMWKIVRENGRNIERKRKWDGRRKKNEVEEKMEETERRRGK